MNKREFLGTTLAASTLPALASASPPYPGRTGAADHQRRHHAAEPRCV